MSSDAILCNGVLKRQPTANIIFQVSIVSNSYVDQIEDEAFNECKPILWSGCFFELDLGPKNCTDLFLVRMLHILGAGVK